ncbi:MAG: hypothetical protein COT14_03850 [Candidatus Diapherotrites archaeon CG08_land_8_20_14_0_20_30_16]|nr:MAG: hypothetical protein COT14_03850 [Candidatus Diapherotrites archaeon CG08_land_8_20_14_0_20_30_16]
MPIKAITFDLWNTLIRDTNPTSHNNLMKYIAEKLGKSYANNMSVKKQTKDEFLHYFKSVVGYKEMKHVDALIRKHTESFTEFTDFECIVPLMKKYKLGIISNASFVTGECLKDWGYAKLFDSIIISYQYEMQKPDKEIFEICAKKMNVKLNEMLHVGNDYKNDYSIPKEQSINTLLLDRKNEHKEVKEKITSLKSLKKYLEKQEKEKH